MRDLQRYTRIRKKSPAIGKAVEDYLHRQKVEALLKMVREGKLDYRTTNEEIEGMWDAPSR